MAISKGMHGRHMQARTTKDRDAHMHAMRDEHGNLLWVHFAGILLGLWLLTSPVTFGFTDSSGFGVDVMRVTAERGLSPPAGRAAMLAWSDFASGLLIMLFASLSLFWRHRWAQWGTCFTGIWLLFAPLVFWSPSPTAYANDTLCGALAIAFSILVPMMPGMDMQAMMAPEDVPPGWAYSPSSWSQRIPVIALAFVGFFIARYLTAYQLGYIDSVWDPFFGDGTRRIISSDVSKAWPIADAGLGALSYLLEALSGMMGGRRRWRTMPWMVAMFGVLVVPLGGVSIFFIVIQPIVIETWCTLCLVSALAMVLMLPYTFDELVAMFQFLIAAKRARQSVWRAFWHGGVMQGSTCEKGEALPVDRRGITAVRAQLHALPKALVASAAIGIWLMFTRLIFDTSGAMANSDHFTGAMIFTFSVCAFAEVVRPLRAINIVFGLWLLIAPWLLNGASSPATLFSMLAGAGLIVLALPRGPVRNSYAAWDSHIAW